MKLLPGFHRHNVKKTLVRDKKLNSSVVPGGFGPAGHKLVICEEGTVNSQSFVEKFSDKDPVYCCLSWVVTSRFLLAVSISIPHILDRWDALKPVCLPAAIELTDNGVRGSMTNN